MKLFSFIIFSILFGCSVRAQSLIAWSYDFDAKDSLIQLTAKIEKGWHIYSQYIDDEIGPIPTTIVFDETPDYLIIGQTKEKGEVEIYDENFGGNLKIFEDYAFFSQKIKYATQTVTQGTILYMLCNESGCLPPEIEKFSIEIY